MRALRRYVLSAAVLALLSVPLSAKAPAQTPAAEAPVAVPAKPAAPELTADTIQAQIAQVKATSDLDENVKAGVLDFYQKALAELDRAATLAKQAAQFKAEADDALKQTGGASALAPGKR